LVGSQKIGTPMRHSVRVRLVLAPVHPTNFRLTKFLALDLPALTSPKIWQKSELTYTERSGLANILELNQAAAQGHGTYQLFGQASSGYKPNLPIILWPLLLSQVDAEGDGTSSTLSLTHGRWRGGLTQMVSRDLQSGKQSWR
jgi:hypothetical protein